jgi:dephospho-CoA kinase
MLKVGITGGIGSGKSVVCQVFTALGIPVFNADDSARYLMEHDPSLIAGITSLFGNDIYSAGKLNRIKLAGIVFKEPAKLQQLNALVHPATIAYAKTWFESRKAPYIIKEAAIFFESGSNRDMDIMVGVFAPRDLRIARAMKRSCLTQQKVEDIMNQQMDEDEKMKLCNYVIVNDDKTAILPQTLSLHEKFTTISAQKKGA